MALSITNGAKVFMALGAKKGTQKAKKSSSKPIADRPLWIPNAEIPNWLDGSLPGDRGFDPLGLAKPVEYLQFDIDEQDQNKAVSKAGDIVGQFKAKKEEVSSTSLQPYSEVFSLQRFRECELIHGRWAMLATLGCIIGELSTGVNWVDAGYYELSNTEYLGLTLPFSISQVVAIEVLIMGYIEVLRNSELDVDKRIYPGGFFDPFNLSTPDRSFRLRTAEIKHARLAMVSMFGFGVQALTTGGGPVENLAAIGRSLGKEI